MVGFVPEVWGGVWMPRHQVMTRLARYFNVLWLNPAQEWRALWSSRQRRRPAPVESGIPGFQVYTPSRLLPVFYKPGWVGRATRDLRARAAVRQLKARGARRILLYLWRPEYDYALDLYPDAPSCYHLDDEYTFSTRERPVGPREADLLRRADRVIIHSPGLWDKKSGFARHPEMVPNGVDYGAFATAAAEPDDLRAIPHPRIGYVGVIKQFLDVPLLVSLAGRHPEWSFVFVGPVQPMGPDTEPFNRLRALPNVHLLGSRAIGELPAYAQHMDVGTMPYDVNGYTKFIYPLKLHEYLAAGLPVVGTAIRTLQDFGSIILLASGVDAWSEALRHSLAADARSPERVAARRAVASQHDWDAIAHRVAGILAEELSPAARSAVAAASPRPPGPSAEQGP